MADYEKMTVANLRVLLKQRGIPATGLTRKAQIIAKLQEQDAANASVPAEVLSQEDPIHTESAATTSPRQPTEATEQPEATSINQVQPSEDSKPQTVVLSASQTPVPSKEEPAIQTVIEPIPARSREDTGGMSQAETDVDERKKRKRRSMTPPVDTQEIAIKKARFAEQVHLREDMLNSQMELEGEDSRKADAKDSAEEQVASHGHSVNETENKSPEDGEMRMDKVGSPKVERKSTRDAINEQLLSRGKGSSDASHPSLDDLPTPDPAIHAATRGLYIRNFMRPLQLNALKRHLEYLSGSSDTEPVEKLHIDSIRSHAFVLTSSQPIAARIRAGTHDQVWPKERDRKPLWVDYIPEEKVQTWIDIENGAAGGPRPGGKKWEVVYENRNGEMVAELREVGVTGAPAAPSKPELSAREQGDRQAAVSAVPSAPKLPQPQEAAKSFLALDKLFPSTKTKPMLYFMPVKAEVADKRLDELDDATSRDWTVRDWKDGDELRRYTFDDDKLVDSGTHHFGVQARQRVEARMTGGTGGHPRYERGPPRGGWRR